jgi:hypothetical protein
MAGGGFGGPPSSRVQLATLIAKLDLLTGEPLTLKLTDAQRARLREQVRGLAEHEELSAEDATKRLDAILEIVKDQRTTLEAAGYRWPGQRGGFRPPADRPNPFREEADGQHLKALEEHLAKGKPS